MKYAVISTVVTDRITLADGRFEGEFLGGAGIYALCGIRVWEDSVVLVTGVGGDFEQRHGCWFDANNVRRDGLMTRDEHTATTRVRYSRDGERVETPVYGLGHYRRLEAAPEDIAPFCEGLRGMYVFKDFGPDGYWDKLLEMKRRHGFRLLWEINADAARQEYLGRVRNIAERADIFSLNRTEAANLLGTATLRESAVALLEWNVPLVYLRAGTDGALLLAGGQVTPVPAVTDARAVDVTGGGNSSSAAVLYGFCEGLPLYECGVMGSISAAFCIGQYGPPALDGETRAKALAMRRELTE